MGMPKKLKNLNLFNDGNSYLGVVKSCTLPTLGRKMEDYRGGGMNGPVKVDHGISDDGIVFEWTLGGWDKLAIGQWGIENANGVQLRFAGAIQRDDTGEVTAVEMVVRGRHEEIDFGDSEAGEDTEHKYKSVCNYFKLLVDGTTVIEIDIINFVEIVNGVDRLAAQRGAIGA